MDTKIWRNARNLLSSFQNLCYPPLCFHCKEPREPNLHLLCAYCLDLLVLLEATERCRLCFAASSSEICLACLNQKPLFTAAAAFDYLGPAANLVKQLKYHNKPYLADGCGAYMAAQFLKLDWPLPDLIVPVPSSFMRRLTRGYNQSQLLAERLGGLIDRPVENLLTRRSGDYSQAGCSQSQRKGLSHTSIQLKPDVNLEGKKVLLIDDVSTTGTTLKRSAEALMEGFPDKIYALTLCIAS